MKTFEEEKFIQKIRVVSSEINECDGSSSASRHFQLHIDENMGVFHVACTLKADGEFYVEDIFCLLMVLLLFFSL